MNKYAVIGGVVVFVVGLIVVGKSVAMNMSSSPGENIIYDTSTEGTRYTDTGDTLVIAVYAKGDFGCTQVEVSIIDVSGGADYFESDCSSSDIWSDTQFTFLGFANIPYGVATVDIN